MVNEQLVSIIVPVYNVKPYIEEAITSLLRQTYKNLEIILVDDGSTDGSGEVCDMYCEKDERVHVIHQANKGLSGARNAGLDVMTAKIVAFLDSDDAYYPDYVRTMVEAMEREQAEIVVCKYQEYTTNENMNLGSGERIDPQIEQGEYSRDDALRALVDKRLNHAAWNKVYVSRLWENVRFPEGHVYEDRYIIYKVIEGCQKIYVVDQPLYAYRRRPDGIINTYSVKNVKDWISSYENLESYVEKNIPAVFSTDHLLKTRQIRTNGMVYFYVCFLQKRTPEKKQFCKELRKQIMECGKSIKYKDKDARMNLIYRMICVCPWLLTVLYPVYYGFHKVRKNGKKA